VGIIKLIILRSWLQCLLKWKS